MKRQSMVVATTAALVVAVAGCSADDDTPAAPVPTEGPLAELVEQARQEGSVTYYTLLDPTMVKQTTDDFTATYGIPVTTVRQSSGILYPRFNSEEAAGAHTADVVIGNMSDSFLTDAIADGFLTPISELDVPGIPATEAPSEELRGTADIPIVAGIVTGICWNTDLVSDSEAPTTWTDLTSPEWADQILTPDPAESDSQLAIVNFINHTYGPETTAEFAGNVRQVFPGAVPQIQALAAGEGEIAAPATIIVAFSLEQTANAPVQCTAPDETTYIPFGGLVSANAPHPAAARLFLSYLLSQQAGAIFGANGGVLTAWGDGITQIPSQLSPLAPASPEEKATLLDIFENRN